MTRNSASRFSSETGFFHSHSRKARLCHSGCLTDSDVFFTLHYSSGKSLCQHLMHLIPISPPHRPLTEQFSLWNPLPQSVGLSFFLSLPLSCCGLSSSVLTALCLITSYMKWQLTSWSYSKGCLLRKSNTHTLSRTNPTAAPPPMCVHIHALSFTQYHTPPPLILDLIQRCVCSSSPLALRGHVRGRGKLHTRLIRLTPESQWNSSTTATEIFTQLTANSRISVLHY